MHNGEDHDVPPMVRQGELISEIGGQLVEKYGTEWSELRLVTRALGVMAEEDVWIEGVSSGTVRRSPPLGTSRLLSELRRVMATPDGGAWYSMTLTIWPDMRAKARFDYDSEPAWRGFAPAYNSFVRELERFPRSEDKLPSWFRPRMEEARLRAIANAAVLAGDD